MIRALAITVSNRAAAGVYEDRSGPVLVELLRSAGCDVVDGPLVIPDGDAVEQVLRDSVTAEYEVGGGGHARRRARGPLRPHERRRLHRGDVAVRGLVGAGAGPDVQHRPRPAERSPDLRGDPWLGAPGGRVAAPDGVVQLPAGHVAAFLTLSARYIDLIYRYDKRRYVIAASPGA